jgi:hypothetical protein
VSWEMSASRWKKNRARMVRWKKVVFDERGLLPAQGYLVVGFRFFVHLRWVLWGCWLRTRIVNRCGREYLSIRESDLVQKHSEFEITEKHILLGLLAIWLAVEVEPSQCLWRQT